MEKYSIGCAILHQECVGGVGPVPFGEVAVCVEDGHGQGGVICVGVVGDEDDLIGAGILCDAGAFRLVGRVPGGAFDGYVADRAACDRDDEECGK